MGAGTELSSECGAVSPQPGMQCSALDQASEIAKRLGSGLRSVPHWAMNQQGADHGVHGGHGAHRAECTRSNHAWATARMTERSPVLLQ